MSPAMHSEMSPDSMYTDRLPQEMPHARKEHTAHISTSENVINKFPSFTISPFYPSLLPSLPPPPPPLSPLTSFLQWKHTVGFTNVWTKKVCGTCGLALSVRSIHSGRPLHTSCGGRGVTELTTPPEVPSLEQLLGIWYAHFLWKFLSHPRKEE